MFIYEKKPTNSWRLKLKTHLVSMSLTDRPRRAALSSIVSPETIPTPLAIALAVIG